MRLVRVMGTFDNWQAQKDSQYILATTYLEDLARQHNSTIEATANYLIHCDTLQEIYEKSDNGEYYPPYHDFNNPHPLIEFLESAKANTDTTNTVLSKDFYRMWDNHYFKKSELPLIEPMKPPTASYPPKSDSITQSNIPTEPQASEVKPHYDPMELGENQKLMRYFETFTAHDLACFITDNNPAYNQNDDDFNKAFLLVQKAINAGKLLPNAQDEIPKEQVKRYLNSIDWIYKGFNDNLPPVTADKIGHATITQTMPTDSQLLQQVADQQATIDRQAKEITQLKAQIAELKSKATEPSDTPATDESELSNVELINLKKAVIAENNRQIATVLKSLDLRGELTKDDLLQVIRPNMESMARLLNGDSGYRVLLVTDTTVKDNHFKNISFPTGRKPKEQTEKNSIQLIFDRQKLPITDN